MPVFLNCGEWDFTKGYFKFENWWMEVERFKERVEGRWISFEISGRPEISWLENLTVNTQVNGMEHCL